MRQHCTIYLVAAICALAAIQITPATSLGSGRAGAMYSEDRRGFFNHSGCLYAYIEGGRFLMTTADEFKINDTLDLENLVFESSKTRCVGEMRPGKLTFTFKLSENKRINTLTVSMKIMPPDTQGDWEVNQANLTVTRADIDRKRTFPLRLTGMYAGSSNSYSCNELTLVTQPRKKMENETKADPQAVLTLNRFQIQPFGELKRHVFAKSRDCSTWMTIPGLTGLVLILFMLAVTIVGTTLLRSIETNDFKFSKEGLQFTQAQQETNKNR